MMTSRVGKAPIPGHAGEPLIFTEEQWALIEKAYGHSLAPEIRNHIVIATDALRLVSASELHAPSLDKMRKKAKTLRKDARSLLQEAGHLVNESSTHVSFEVLASALNTAMKEYPNEHPQFLLVVKSTLSACDVMLRHWESDGVLHDGWIWDAWVQSINMLMQYHGLPSTARTDTRDMKKVNSEFVWLINELQEHLPRSLRRHDHSTDALAKAIQRARKSNWWPKLIPPYLREKFAPDLESFEERVKRYALFEEKLKTSPGWVEVRPGRFERVEMVELKKRPSRDEK
jgi:hypothetical protein